MAITEKDWKAHTTRVVERPIPFNEALLRQASVEASKLTGHPEWDHYLQRLQSLVEDTRRELDGWLEKVSGAYADADLRLVQNNVNMCKERLATLTMCMNLPKEIIEHAAQHGLIARPDR